MTHTSDGWWQSEGFVDVPPEAEVNDTLRWIIKQMNLGFFDCLRDDEGRGVTLVIGAQAARDVEADAAIEALKARQLALNFAQVLTDARERGVKPEHVDLSESARFLATANAAMNTEFHYALQLMDILKDMRQRTFLLVSLPIVERVSRELLGVLHEATRAHLLGLHSACIALCRAAMERALVERLPPASVVAQKDKWPKRGDVENLINAATELQLLDQKLGDMAHRLRMRANKVLHGGATADDSFGAIFDTRLVVDRLFAVEQHDPTGLLGIDGCKGGWVVARAHADLSDLRFSVTPTIAAVVQELREGNQLAAIDIPIGLPSKESRACDLEARKLLGPGQGSRVFPAPARAVLKGNSYAECCGHNTEALGVAISQQLFGILPKIRDADAAVTPEVQERFREAHPEVSFRVLAGAALQHDKKSPQGQQERLAILQTAGLKFDPVVERKRLGGAAALDVDDLLDAAVCLLTAHRIANGRAQTLGNGQRDERGLRMEILA